MLVVRSPKRKMLSLHLPRRGVSILAAGVLLLLLVSPSLAAPADQVGPAAPENLRCAGRPAPPLPGPGWTVEPVWAWQDLVHTDGSMGSGVGPHGVAVDRQCNTYVTDSQNVRILKLAPDGAVVARWTLPGDRAASESSSPHGVAVDSQGNVYATDPPRDRVYKFSPQGALTATFGDCPPGQQFCDPTLPGRFLGPEGIAVDGAGNVYVSESAGDRVQKLSNTGQSLAIWNLKTKGIGELFLPSGLSIDQGGFVYLAETYNNLVLKFDPASGAIVGRWGGPIGGEPGQFHAPLGVGVDAAGNLYIADRDNWRVQKLGPDGSFQAHWRLCLDGDPPCEFPDAGAEPGQFMVAHGIALDGQGSVYVADTGNSRVQRLVIVDWVLVPPPDPEGLRELTHE
jgi:DNA-binding beta-propeller fold protein YncE